MIVLCGTNRPEANTRKVSKRLHQMMADCRANKGLSAPLYLDLEALRPEIFSPSSYGPKPSWFTLEFQEPILKANGILVIIPEYNGSFPGVLKYFIDMLKFPENLVNVPVAFVGCAAGQWGALRSVEQLEMIFAYRKSHLYGERLFIPAVGSVIQSDGKLGEYEERARSLVEGFSAFAENHTQK